MCSLPTVLDFELFTRHAGPDNRYQAACLGLCRTS
jgi:hypothetical protein